MPEYYMYHKPLGCVTARSDARFPTVMDAFPPELRARLRPVGRLDRETQGLLLMTDDGELNFRLTNPVFGIEKEYFFWALGQLDAQGLEKIRQGVILEGAKVPTLPASLTLLEHARLGSLEALLSPRYRAHLMKNPDAPAFSGLLRVREGKYHEVRRLLASQHCAVIFLRRTALGPLRLDGQLQPGFYRPLQEEELALLRQCVERKRESV